MQSVYININNDVINDIFNLDSPDEYQLDQSLIDIIEGNETKKTVKKPKKETAKKTTSKTKKKSDKKIIKIKRRK